MSKALAVITWATGSSAQEPNKPLFSRVLKIYKEKKSDKTFRKNHLVAMKEDRDGIVALMALAAVKAYNENPNEEALKAAYCLIADGKPDQDMKAIFSAVSLLGMGKIEQEMADVPKEDEK